MSIAMVLVVQNQVDLGVFWSANLVELVSFRFNERPSKSKVQKWLRQMSQHQPGASHALMCTPGGHMFTTHSYVQTYTQTSWALIHSVNQLQNANLLIPLMFVAPSLRKQTQVKVLCTKNWNFKALALGQVAANFSSLSLHKRLT